MNLWPHQQRTIDEIRRAYAQGYRKVLAVAPPGAGKSRIMRELVNAADKKSGWPTNLLVHRSMLLEQTMDCYAEDGIDFGVRASGYKPDDAKPHQVSMIQTEAARQKTGAWALHEAKLVIVDEAHQQTAGQAMSILDEYRRKDAFVVGFTATPVDCGWYEKLIQAANYSDLLACNAHLPIVAFGPDRPDTAGLQRMKGGEYSSNDVASLMKVPTIFGRVYEHWCKLNPFALPTILWAPGVAESKWFVEHFVQRGVMAAHIDGESIHVPERSNGHITIREYDSTKELRREVLERSKEGDIKIICNRFVLREAIDMPWIAHGILATIFGAVSSYLQTVGRIQRYWPSYDAVTLQDHGGNYDRHLPPDMDREWELGATNTSIANAIKKAKEKTKGDEAEPICCPNCCSYRTHGSECPQCGYRHKRSTRMVRQIDGQLVAKVGREVKYKRPKNADDYLRSAIYAGSKSGMTVGQVVWLAKKNMADAGVDGDFSIRLPDKGSSQWNDSARRHFPWATKKKAKA